LVHNAGMAAPLVLETLSIDKKKIHFFQSLPFFLFHGVGLVGAFFVSFKWSFLALCLGSYYLRMFAITAGYHRYFSHRSYRLNRFFQFLMALLGSTTAQKGVLWWAAHHRHHHQFSDQPGDLHSPALDGFWWSHVGWILSDHLNETDWKRIPDFAQCQELKFLNRFWIIPLSVYGAAIYFVGGWEIFYWAFILSTILLWHGTFTINSLSHVYGSRRYATTDTSRNNFWLALITMGEGWHNNHHCYMSSTNQGFFWWEIDMSYYILRVLSCLGIVSGLRKPPLDLLENKRLKC